MHMTVVGKLRALATKLREWWAVLVAAYRVYMVQRVLNMVVCNDPFWVYKAYAFDSADAADSGSGYTGSGYAESECTESECTESDCADFDIRHGPDFKIVTKAFAPLGQPWEETVRQATQYPSFKVDLRYLAHGKKFRMVLRPGDAFSFPQRHRGGPKGVLAAELVGYDGVAVDVTRRVLKYQGPAKDFHRGMGLRVSVADLFPKDDIEELASDFKALRLVDAHGRFVNIPFDCDDLGAALKHD